MDKRKKERRRKGGEWEKTNFKRRPE